MHAEWEATMAIETGAKLPDATVKLVGEAGPADAKISDIFAGKKAVLFAVPGAFTPTCHVSHLPGFLNNLDAFAAKGVDKVVCLAVNDPFVVGAWAKASAADGKIAFIADWDAAYTRALGMDIDLGVAGLGVRSKRYAMLVEDGTVKALHIEDQPGKAEISSAEALLAAL
jgi:peroxiredoxin